MEVSSQTRQRHWKESHTLCDLVSGSDQLSWCRAAVFFMDPDHGATNEPVVFAQLTVRSGSQFNGIINAQGKAVNGQDDWTSTGLQFNSAGENAPPPPPPCPVGTHFEARSRDCAACPAGRVQPRINMAVCSDCPAGTYQFHIGQAECIACGRGKYGTRVGSNMESGCTACPSGRTSTPRSDKLSDCQSGMPDENEFPPPAPPRAAAIEVGFVTDRALADDIEHFNTRFRNPVVIAGTPSHTGDEAAVARVRSIDLDAQTLDLYLDIPNHAQGQGAICGAEGNPTESFSWMIVESGYYPESGMEAGADTGGICAGGDLCTESYGCVEHDGFPQCDHSTGFDWVSFRFTRPLENPVVVSTIQSHTGNDWCKTRQRSVSNDGFHLKVEEDGLDVGHNTEMFGWVAITAGTGRIAGTVYEAIVTPDAVTHDPYFVRFSAGFRSPPGLFSSMHTYDGTDPAHMRQAMLSAQGAQLWVEEESCTDAEVRHTNEVVGVIAIALPAGSVPPPPPPPPVAAVPCNMGAYSLSGNAPCIDCAAGKYNDKVGGTSCTSCPADTFQPTTGASADAYWYARHCAQTSSSPS